LWLNIPSSGDTLIYSWPAGVAMNKINIIYASACTVSPHTTAETAAGYELITADGIYFIGRGNKGSCFWL